MSQSVGAAYITARLIAVCIPHLHSAFECPGPLYGSSNTAGLFDSANTAHDMHQAM